MLEQPDTREELPASDSSEGSLADCFCIDRNGVIKSWESSARSFCGRSAESTIGKSFNEILCPLVPKEVPSFKELSEEWAGFYALTRPEGLPVAVKVTLRPAGNDEDLSVGLDWVVDKAEARAPDTVPQRLDAMLQGMPGFCYTVNTELVFTSSRGAGLAQIELTDDQLVGVYMPNLWGTSEAKYEPLQCHLRVFAGMTQYYRDVCLGRSLEYRLSPLRDDSGRIIGAIGVGVDVTEREKHREEKAKLTAQLRQAQKMESVGQLAGGVAHDFNNLLTCIMGNVSLASESLSADSDALRMLEEANAAAESAATLTRQLLAYSRKQVIDPRPINLSVLIKRVQSMLRRLIGEGIVLRTSCPDDLWYVRADPGQLEQILVNLIVNARDAISENGEIVLATANHELQAEGGDLPPELEAGRYVRLSVRDNGRGMSDVVRTKLFEPFFTTKETGEGTGLGLATVYGAVQQNGGTVTVDSELGKGATFNILLPRVDAPTEVSPVEVQRPSKSYRSLGGTETILLVEDEASVLELAQRALEQLGYNVLPCASADEALRVFGRYQDKVQLLVTDVVMPRMNGKELASRVTSLHPGISVLYTSGYGENIIATNGVIEPQLHFIAKPYRPRQLVTKVREVLDARVSSPVAPGGPEAQGDTTDSRGPSPVTSQA